MSTTVSEESPEGPSRVRDVGTPYYHGDDPWVVRVNVAGDYEPVSRW